MSEPRISLIIPARNEEDYLPRLLDTVDIARENFYLSADAVEVIVSDNDSTDSTAEIATSRGCIVAREERRLIAAVRNAGAAVARGEILCFTDADGQIHPDTFNVIDEAVSSGKYIGGATGVELDRMTLGIWVTYYIFMLPMVWVTGMDTGVVFCRKNDFQQMGGYNENLSFAEDVDFLVRLKLLGRKRKQKLARLTSARAIASMRKFRTHGNWHFIPLLCRGIPAMFFPSMRFQKYAKKYWYDR